jgi:hypothetical protein
LSRCLYLPDKLITFIKYCQILSNIVKSLTHRLLRSWSTFLIHKTSFSFCSEFPSWSSLISQFEYIDSGQHKLMWIPQPKVELLSDCFHLFILWDPSNIIYQLSVISYQLSVINY